MLNLFQHLILFKTEICHAELVSASHPLKIEIIPSNASPLTSPVSRLFASLSLCLKSLYLFTSSSQVSLSPVSLSFYPLRASSVSSVVKKNSLPSFHPLPEYPKPY
jgi:hypothetical protein